MDPIRTFWCEATGFVRVSLRVFTFSADAVCPAQADVWTTYEPGHSASALLYEVAEAHRDENGYLPSQDAELFAGHPAWPTACEHCGAPVTDEWERIVDQDAWYKAPGVGQWILAELPAGAMYDAPWLPANWHGDDGIALTVTVPNGKGGAVPWHVDMEAGNCSREGERHKCWCRHGDPRSDPVTVDKDCDTCTAGAGSIGIGGSGDGNYDWHGFLRNGFLIVA